MALQDRGWESLVQRAEQVEQKARRRAIIFSVIPAVLAGLLLWFTGYQIQQASRQLVKVQGATQAALAQRDDAQSELARTQAQYNRVQSDLAVTQKKLDDTQQTLSATQGQLQRTEQDKASLQKQLDALKKSLDDTTRQMKLATDFSKYEFTGAWAPDLKLMMSLYPEPQVKLLLSIMDVQNAPWKLGGFSPQEGFDSPGFAAYILANNRLINVPAGFERTQAGLRALLPARTGRPRVGDVVFYEAGYTMFYFETYTGQPFVIGMTPLGVLALKPDFAPVVGYGAVFP